ncbi:MAG: tagatose 1,6-diphosphate aldolase [Anaerolineaceae bacterium]|nr:tagatose 1,6-diphosphate aldolase [Anaerolineaceae bacterium]
MESLSFGKLRGIEKCTTSKGALSVLALDHRNNLRQALNPTHPELVSNTSLSEFKMGVTEALAPHASAVLLDPEVGAFQAVTSGSLLGSVGLVVALEATGYTGETSARESCILDSWGVEKAKRMGADAVKLLVYYHPDSQKASEIENLVAHTAEVCKKFEMFFMLEPLSYSIVPSEKKVSGVNRKHVVIETARRLTACGGDILKAEFPLDINLFPDESAWVSACSELTETIHIPWVLLSASVDFETYFRQVEIACHSGASGVAVGRAVWIEATELDPKDRGGFLLGTAAERMQRITKLVDKQAAPFTKYYEPPEVNESTYRAY